MVEVDGEGVAGDVAFAEFLAFLALAVEVVEGLVPAADQQVGGFVFGGDRAPLHAPDGGVELDLVLGGEGVTFSSRLRCRKERVPLMEPKARVCPSADQPEEMIFSLNFSLGISFFPGMKSAKSAAPPLKSS